jgi:hypothetical protein
MELLSSEAGSFCVHFDCRANGWTVVPRRRLNKDRYLMNLTFISLSVRYSRADKALISVFALLFVLLGGLISPPAHALSETCLNTSIKTGAVPVGPHASDEEWLKCITTAACS